MSGIKPTLYRILDIPTTPINKPGTAASFDCIRTKYSLYNYIIMFTPGTISCKHCGTSTDIVDTVQRVIQ